MNDPRNKQDCLQSIEESKKKIVAGIGQRESVGGRIFHASLNPWKLVFAWRIVRYRSLHFLDEDYREKEAYVIWMDSDGKCWRLVRGTQDVLRPTSLKWYTSRDLQTIADGFRTYSSRFFIST